MPARTAALAIACLATGAAAGAAFVQPGAPRRSAAAPAAGAGIQHQEFTPAGSPPEAEGAGAAKGLLAGLALGFVVALAGAHGASAADEPLKQCIITEGCLPGSPESKKWAKAMAAKTNDWKFGRPIPEKYKQCSTGCGTYLQYNNGIYGDWTNYQGTAKDNGKYILNINRGAAGYIREAPEVRERAKDFLVDGGAYGAIYDNKGLYKPRIYSSAYQKTQN